MVIFPSNRISSSRRCELLRIIDFREENFLAIYLGAPLVSGILLSHNVDFLIEKIRNKVAS